MNTLISPQRSLERTPGSAQDWWLFFWRNRPVPDEAQFTQDFRRHAFTSTLVATWAAAIVGTINTVHRALFLKNYEPLTQTVQAYTPTPGNHAIFESVVLYWSIPVFFTIFRPWSRRNYQWVLVAAYAYYFARLIIQIATGHRTIDDANVSTIMLISFSVIFLRLPFKHAFFLSVGATALVEIAAIQQFAEQAFRLAITSTLTLFLSLHASWRMEERERSIYQKRMLAQDIAAEAQRRRNEAERVAVQAKLLHAEISTLYAQRELFIRGLHHDAMQSLHVMGSMILVIKQKLSEDLSLSRLLGEVKTLEQGTNALGDLVSGMYDLVSLGQYVPRYEPVSVNALLDRCARQFTERAREKGLKFVVKPRGDDLFVRTDRSAVERIVDNLTSNAIKYTSRGGVVVGTVKVGGTLRIDICDTGVGIPKEHKHNIFKEFVRLQQQGEQNIPGQGLGLAIVNLLREKLRDSGFYLEHNSRVARGTRFSVSLPVTAAPSVCAPKTAELRFDMSRLYVVVVDDNAVVQASLSAVLRSAGYNVDEMVRFASSTAELNAIFDKMPYRPPGVVICDYRLGMGENANDVIRILDARFDWAPRVPVLVYSAEIEPQLTLDRPRVRVVTKSNNLSVLLQEMETVVLEAKAAALEEPEEQEQS